MVVCGSRFLPVSAVPRESELGNVRRFKGGRALILRNRVNVGIVGPKIRPEVRHPFRKILGCIFVKILPQISLHALVRGILSLSQGGGRRMVVHRSHLVENSG